MSQSIGFACNSSIGFDKIRDAIIDVVEGSKLVNFDESNKDLQIAKGHEWYINISEAGDLRNIAIEDYLEISNSEDLRVKASDLFFYIIRYNDHEVARIIITSILKSFREQLGEFWIDNNYGVIVNGRTFLANLERDPGWDWRSKDI